MRLSIHYLFFGLEPTLGENKSISKSKQKATHNLECKVSKHNRISVRDKTNWEVHFSQPWSHQYCWQNNMKIERKESIEQIKTYSV